jgi:hypothetical protein
VHPESLDATSDSGRSTTSGTQGAPYSLPRGHDSGTSRRPLQSSRRNLRGVNRKALGGACRGAHLADHIGGSLTSRVHAARRETTEDRWGAREQRGETWGHLAEADSVEATLGECRRGSRKLVSSTRLGVAIRCRPRLGILAEARRRAVCARPESSPSATDYSLRGQSSTGSSSPQATNDGRSALNGGTGEVSQRCHDLPGLELGHDVAPCGLVVIRSGDGVLKRLAGGLAALEAHVFREEAESGPQAPEGIVGTFL